MNRTTTLVNTIVASLSALDIFKEVEAALVEGSDVSLATPITLRAAFVATQFFVRPRTMLVVTETQEQADSMRAALLGYLSADQVALYPERADLPWDDKAPQLSQIAARTRCLHLMASGEKVVIVGSLKAFMRAVALDHPEFFAPLQFRVGEELGLEHCIERLTLMGFERSERVFEEGTFTVRGDVIEIHPPLGTPSVHVDFFGDEIESIKRLAPASGQTLGSLEYAELYPLREIALTPDVVKRGIAALEKPAFLDTQVAYHRDLLEQGISFNELGSYLSLLVERIGSPAHYMHADATVEAVEPRVLFDASLRAFEEYNGLAIKAGFKNVLGVTQPLKGLFLSPAELDFGACGRLTWMTTLNAARADYALLARRPDVAGSDARLLSALKTYLESGYNIIFSIPNRRIRERVIELLAAHGLPVGDRKGAIKMTEQDVVTGFIVPDARLAVISQTDAFPRSLKKVAKRQDIDITKLTFPFKPGDYVVHATYGIALLKDITRREVDGVERDYLQLEYAEGDTLYTPIDQIDRVTKYVGPDGSAPKVTRLGGKAWGRAIERARKAAKKLAFDLVNLYARRTQVKGYAFGPDTAWQKEMEDLFPYEPTPDQLEAIADVKADMEAEKPMDRLVCGDVGYGKTEVAIRAAFKAVQDGKQVMVLCPTTILAQQHFTTFFERFAPFDVEVEVLSRFRTPAQQKRAVERFAEGKVNVLVGTHRLLSKDISPYDLGLLIIDEEQRFGVEHKEKLKNMRESIDVLAMSATPIPRTLQMSLSGVRDMSVIDTPPANRFPVKVTVAEYDSEIITHAIRTELERNGQVYYISNRVKTIDEAYKRVHEAAPEARIGVAHGQMSEHELEEVMEAFAANEIDVLLSTTIVESGIDNPHSNTLIIENAHMLGLAQLYQLKGRVGRSHIHAFAYFLYPRGIDMTPTALERLMAIAENDGLGSGIRIAMRDLEIRGAGSLLGAEQSGQLSSIGFDLFASMISEAVAAARGEEPVSFPNIHIDLPDPAFIPDDYIEDVFERITLYRRIAGLATGQGIDKLFEQMEAMYGVAPEPTINLFTMTRIKVMCAEIGAEGVSVSGAYIQVKLPKPDENMLASLRSIGALYDERRSMLRWKAPYGESVVNAARTLAGAILFDSKE